MKCVRVQAFVPEAAAEGFDIRIVRNMKMDYAASLQEGVRFAKQLRGEHAAISVIPNGVSLMISRKEPEKQ